MVDAFEAAAWEAARALTLAAVTRLLDAQDYRFAKTMPQIPHWYVRRQDWTAGRESFAAVAGFVRLHGVTRRWGRRDFTYLRVGEWEYWTMGAPLAETVILNRARAE